MTDEGGPHGELLADEERMHPFGEFLRSTSIDELPELFNVLTGDMSLVGPRTLVMQYLSWAGSGPAPRRFSGVFAPGSMSSG